MWLKQVTFLYYQPLSGYWVLCSYQAHFPLQEQQGRHTARKAILQLRNWGVVPLANILQHKAACQECKLGTLDLDSVLLCMLQHCCLCGPLVCSTSLCWDLLHGCSVEFICLSLRIHHLQSRSLMLSGRVYVQWSQSSSSNRNSSFSGSTGELSFWASLRALFNIKLWEALIQDLEYSAIASCILNFSLFIWKRKGPGRDDI